MIRSHDQLRVYQRSFQAAMMIFELTKSFPKDELYALVSQIRRSSRSVTANIAEAFRKRRYPRSFIAKLSDAEAEAAETITWLEYSLKCNYVETDSIQQLQQDYDQIIGMLVRMIRQADNWQTPE